MNIGTLRPGSEQSRPATGFKHPTFHMWDICFTTEPRWLSTWIVSSKNVQSENAQKCVLLIMKSDIIWKKKSFKLISTDFKEAAAILFPQKKETIKYLTKIQLRTGLNKEGTNWNTKISIFVESRNNWILFYANLEFNAKNGTISVSTFFTPNPSFGFCLFVVNEMSLWLSLFIFFCAQSLFLI